MNTSYEEMVKRHVTEHSSHYILPRKAASSLSPGQSRPQGPQPPILISAGWTRSDHPVKQSQPPAHSWKPGPQGPMAPGGWWASQLRVTPLMRPQKFPDTLGSLEGNTKGPGPLHLSPFSPPDRDRRGDSPAFSGRGSRPSWCTSG